MNRRTILFGLVLALGMVAVTAGALIVAPSEFDSATESLLRPLHQLLLAIAIPLGLFVQVALFYTALRFHRNDDPKPTEENRRLEITWTIAVGVILLFVGASSYVVLADPMVSTPPDATPAEDSVVVEVVGQNWFWTVSYPGENVTTRNEIVLPVNRTIFFRVASRDVIHSVHVPALGIKQDAIPGQTNPYRTRATDTGNYTLYCAEYCGSGHSTMLATVRVVGQDAYRSWLQRQGREATAGNESSGSG